MSLIVPRSFPLPLSLCRLAYKEGVRFRSYNQVWRDHVQAWVGRVIEHTRSYFADHGGPIVLAQIENELNGADARYVQWNGDMANAFNVNVPWLMCNGESANNTINACNGNDCTGFIMSNGQSGRILKDQPALWTENEGWFESWGDVTYPVEGPFSERQPEDISYAIARWFARGGSHMNYYVRRQLPSTVTAFAHVQTTSVCVLPRSAPLLCSDVPRRQPLRPHSCRRAG